MSISGNNNDGKLPAAAEAERTTDDRVHHHHHQQLYQQLPPAHESLPELSPGYRDFRQSRLAFRSTGSAFQGFPQKLHEILFKPEYSNACSWLPHGRAWVVHNTRDFEQFVLPKYFR